MNNILFTDVLKNINNVTENIVQKKNDMTHFNNYINLELKKIKDKIHELKEKIKSLINSTNKINTSIENNNEIIVYKNIECDDLIIKINQLKQERDNLLRQLENISKKTNENPNEIYNNLEQNVSQLLEKKDSLMVKRENLLKELNKENEVNSTPSNNYNLNMPSQKQNTGKEQIVNLKEELHNTEQDIDDLHDIIESYKTPENKDLINKILQLTKYIQDVKNENENLKYNISKLEEENRSLYELLLKAKQQIEEITKKLNSFDLEQTEIIKNKTNIDNYIKQINNTIAEINNNIDNTHLTTSGGKKNKKNKKKKNKTAVTFG